jgi:hypothetical protein
LTKLEQAQALDHAVLMGSNSLVGHMIALSMVERRLQATMLVASQHPQLAAELAARLHPADGLSTSTLAAAQRRWIAFEASFGRSMAQSLGKPDACEAVHQATRGNMDPIWLCKLQLRAAMPEYTSQLFMSQWLDVLALLDDRNPTVTVQGVKGILEREPSGWFGSSWHWRGTIPHILVAVASPAYKDYFARGADTYLASESTRLWLLAQAEQLASGNRSTWLASHLQGHPLAAHLTEQPDGSWQLKRLSSRQDSRISRWLAPA